MKAMTNTLGRSNPAIILACSLFALASIAADAPPPRGRSMPEGDVRGNVGRPEGGMLLDGRQQQLFAEALQKYREDLAKFDGEMGLAMTELMKASLAWNFDEKAVREKAQAIGKIQVEIMLRRSRALSVVVPTLKPEQREHLLTGGGSSVLLANGFMDRRGPGMEPGAPGREFARGPQPPADSLAENLFDPELVMRFQTQAGLSEQQRQAIMSDLQQAQPKFAKLHEQLEKERAVLASLLKKERVELEPALAQADKLLEVERELRRLQLSVQIGLKNRLTPEQQEILHDLKRKSPSGNPMAAGPPPAIQGKMQRLQAAIQQWQNEGRDASVIAGAMQEFEPLMQSGQFDEAETVLDHALDLLQSKGSR